MLKLKIYRRWWVNVVVYGLIIGTAIWLLIYAVFYDSRWGLLSS